MKKKVFILFFLLLSVIFSWSQGVRKPIVAGQFYEKNREILSSQIDSFLQAVKTRPPLPKTIQALIVPHAGYLYSGPVAASAYRLIEGKDYETVVILGPSHQYGFEGCSIYLEGGFETPLGLAKVDDAVAREISKASGYKYIAEAHKMEHSIEVQVPFIQKTLPQAKIVPIVMGFPSRRTIYSLADALAEVLPQKKALVIASTDMSHFFSKKEANDLDSKTISLIQSIKTDTLVSKLERGENILCGGGAVVSTLLYLKKKRRDKRRNSQLCRFSAGRRP